MIDLPGFVWHLGSRAPTRRPEAPRRPDVMTRRPETVQRVGPQRDVVRRPPQLAAQAEHSSSLASFAKELSAVSNSMSTGQMTQQSSDVVQYTLGSTYRV